VQLEPKLLKYLLHGPVFEKDSRGNAIQFLVAGEVHQLTDDCSSDAPLLKAIAHDHRQFGLLGSVRLHQPADGYDLARPSTGIMALGHKRHLTIVVDEAHAREALVLGARLDRQGVRGRAQALGTAAMTDGDWRDAIAFAERLEEAGVDEIMTLIQMGTVPQGACMETIRQWGEHVIPHFNKKKG